MESISTSIHRLKDYLINDVPRSICSQSLLVLKIDIGDGKSFTIYKGLLTDLENNSDTFVNLLEVRILVEPLIVESLLVPIGLQ